MKRLVLLLLACSGICIAQKPAAPAAEPPTRETYLRLAGEVDNALHTDVLNVWFPRTVDHEHGGFHSHFSRDCSGLPATANSRSFRAE
jgi:mannobiose 2-epimerase